jgi:uncharacterized Zn finger protein
MQKPAKVSWGVLWLDALAAAGWGSRLKRGAAYTREGQIGGLQVQPGQAAARIGGGGPGWQPRLAVRPLSAREWATAAEALLGAPDLAAALDAGELPPAAAGVLADAGVALLPGEGEVDSDCGCTERQPCRHVAALCYLLAEHLERDPWVLPLLRGRSRGALMDALAEARARLVPDEPVSPMPAPELPTAPEPAPPPSPALPASFWEAGAGLADFYVEIAAPPQPAPLLRQLGPPPFWTPPAAFGAQLEPAYAAVTAAVLRLVHGDDTEDAPDR